MLIYAITRQTASGKEYFCILLINEPKPIISVTTVKQNAVFYLQSEIDYALRIAKERNPKYEPEIIKDKKNKYIRTKKN